MKVAVIGGTGFVGSHVVRALESAGHEVSLLVRPGSESKSVRLAAHFHRHIQSNSVSPMT